ncbi:hypothetical protein GF340_04140 [Candidatus Peregrinibacteria bacterium]|nr:hypothetical protein [Candidatus Peregrinibacteria bacterium]
MEKNIREQAREYRKYGFTVIPIERGGKRPLTSWGRYYERPQTENDFKKDFPDDNRNIGLVGGECSDNALFLDFDCRTKYQKLIEHNRTLRRITSETTVVSTHRGVQVYLRTLVPVKNGKIKDLDLDIKATGGYVVAPPSLHPSGQFYLFEKGLCNIYRLRTLDELDFLQLNKAISNRPPWYGIGNLFGVLKGENLNYKSRSEAEAGLVYNLVKNNWSFEQVYELFNRNAVDGTKFRDKKDQSSNYLYVHFKNAEKHYESNKRIVDKKIDEMIRFIKEYSFNPRTRHTDFAVSYVILEIARRSGKLKNIDLSVREVAENAGISLFTASKALTRLPFLVKTSEGNSREPASYSIDESFIAINSQTLTHTRCYGMCDFGNNEFSEDIYRTAGVGKTGHRILKTLENADWLTAQHVAKSSGIPYRTVKRKLNHLRDLDAVFTDGKVRGTSYKLKMKMNPEGLKELAQKLGVDGKGERERAEHKRDRKRYREYMAIMAEEKVSKSA